MKGCIVLEGVLSLRDAAGSDVRLTPPLNGGCRFMSQRSWNTYGTLPTLAMPRRPILRAERRVEEVRQVAQEIHGRGCRVALDPKLLNTGCITVNQDT